MADRDRATALLQAIIAEYKGDESPNVLTWIFGRVHQLPERISDIAGEPVDVDIDTEGDVYRFRVKLEMTGRDSGHDYGRIKLEFGNDQGKLKFDPIITIALMVYCALNHPADMPDWVMHTLADRGLKLIGCDFCAEKFVTFRDAQRHERDAHADQLAA